MEGAVNQVKRRVTAATLLLLMLLTGRATAEPRVLIVSIDGLRPDVALRADEGVVLLLS